ncbi:hypothetical protein F5887DRAFT_1076779 [Amanita rubescens]|nr:hypothetical protein F5887DRAFT_1076779 [Amanita rubescens]
MSLTRTVTISAPTYSRQRPTRNARYYIDGGDLHLLVGGVLFRVHSYFFKRDSSRFLPVPTCGHAHSSGYSDEHPIIVDADPIKFEKLLWVFYNDTYSEYDASIEDWSDILELAHEWAFVQAKRLALRELQKLSMPIAERIALYLKYHVSCEYLIPLYVELCSRSETLGLEEAELIGLPVAIIIFRLREELRVRTPQSPPPPPPPESPLPIGITPDDVRARVLHAFGFPFEVANQPGVSPVLPTTQDLPSVPMVAQPRLEAEEHHGITDEPVVSVVARERAPSPRHQGTVIEPSL